MFRPIAATLAMLMGVGSLLAQPTDLDPRVGKLINAVSEDRLRALLSRLQGFETRNTLSAPDSPTRGIGAARQWIHDEMARFSPRLQVSFDTYQLPKQGERIARDVELRNVVAVLPGRSARRIYVSGHYDSLARDPKSTTPGFNWAEADNVAPGANDDGSGTVLTMELARVFAESGVEFDATLVFAAFAGEEQGLVGAKAHAQKARAEKLTIDAVLNNDVVGNSLGGGGIVDAESVRVFSEGPSDSPSRQLARFAARWGSRYFPSHQVRLIARYDRFGRGGDHIAFNQNGYAAIRFTEANENYSRQHSVDDVVEAVDFTYLARNARVNAAVAASLALAPPAPVVADERGRPLLGRQPTGYDARLQWQASPRAAAYRIFWRRAWTPDWEHELAVGNVTEYVLPNVSIDDYIFGVAAVGAEGHESLVSAYVNPPRVEERIITRD
jgi:hypothetical protein